VNDVALVRLVTRRHRELQGLRTIADAGVMILIGAGLSLRTYTALAFIVDFVALCGYGWLWWKWTRHTIGAYYASRVGRVAVRGWGLPVTVTTMVALQFGAICIDLRVARWASVALFAMMLVAVPAWYVVRDWPYRIHWLLPTAAAGIATASFAKVVNHEDATLWWGEFALLIGTALLIAGWFDHRLLLRTMTPRESTAHAGNDI
jgi:hypothetical protein